MRATFGASSCHLLRINTSGGPEQRVGYDGQWSRHIRAPLPGGGAGEPVTCARIKTTSVHCLKAQPGSKQPIKFCAIGPFH